MRTCVRNEPTVGQIALRLGCPVHWVEYLVRARGIRPVRKAGNARIFRESDIAYLVSELRRNHNNRGKGDSNAE